MEKKTLMITGASGFIGRNFIEKYKNEYNIIPVSLREKTPEELDYTGVDTILHLAALVHQMKGAPEEKYFEVNTKLTERLARKSKECGVKHFVFYSTVAVYGTHGSLDEDMILTIKSETNPKTPYAKSKLEAERVLEGLKDGSFEVSVIRPPMVYGKNCPGNMKRLEKLVDIFPILPFGNNERRRSLVHIEKLLEITKEVIENKIELIIPIDEKDLSIREIVEKILVEKKKKRILIRFPNIFLKTLHKLKPNIIESLYGELIFRADK